MIILKYLKQIKKIKKKISFKQPVFVVNNPATRDNYGHFLYEVYLKILKESFNKFFSENGKFEIKNLL